MKKRTFLLLELFIALGLFALFSVPLVHGLSFHAKKKKNRLLVLEKERRAEELFYKIYKHLRVNHKDLEEISKDPQKEIYTLTPDTTSFDLGKLGTKTFFWHYHLYRDKAKPSPLCLLRLTICFLESPKAKCQPCTSFQHAEYGFTLTIKNKP